MADLFALDRQRERLASCLVELKALPYGDLRLFTTTLAMQDADALVIMTEWRQFKAPDFDAIKVALKQPLIFDGRNLFEPARMRERGFVYQGIGVNTPQGSHAGRYIRFPPSG